LGRKPENKTPVTYPVAPSPQTSYLTFILNTLSATASVKRITLREISRRGNSAGEAAIAQRETRIDVAPKKADSSNKHQPIGASPVVIGAAWL
jgi:hypothetical protein